MVANLVAHHKALLRENRDVFFRTFEVPLTRFMHPLEFERGFVGGKGELISCSHGIALLLLD